MQLAIDEDRRVQKPDEGEEIDGKQKARSAEMTTGCVGITSGSLV